MAPSDTVQADERGRLSLGPKFARRTFIVENQGDAIVLRPAVVIPETEAWLYQNPEALERLRTGLAQARRRQFANPPALAEARRVVANMPAADD